MIQNLKLSLFWIGLKTEFVFIIENSFKNSQRHDGVRRESGSFITNFQNCYERKNYVTHHWLSDQTNLMQMTAKLIPSEPPL